MSLPGERRRGKIIYSHDPPPKFQNFDHRGAKVGVAIAKDSDSAKERSPKNAKGMLKTVFKAISKKQSTAAEGPHPFRHLCSLVYGENGQPKDVLELKDTEIREIGPGEALVEWLAVSFS